MAFNCQRCKQPLRIDDTLTDLDSAATDLLVGRQWQPQFYYMNVFSLRIYDIAPLSAEEQYQQQLRQSKPRYTDPVEPISRRLIGVKSSNAKSPNKKQQRESFPLPSESFVVLTRSQVGQTSAAPQQMTSPSSSTVQEDTDATRNNSLSHRLRVASRLFNVMSSRSSVDHPMCQECTDMLLESLDKQLVDVGLERDCYIEYLEKVKDGRISDEELKELEQQVTELKLAEQDALADLAKAREDHEAVTKEMEELEAEMKVLEDREQQFWEQYNDYELKLENYQNERASINLKYDHDVKQYERLQKTVVYNDAFCISQEGPFGTINGFRLGRISSQPVSYLLFGYLFINQLMLGWMERNQCCLGSNPSAVIHCGKQTQIPVPHVSTKQQYE